MYDESKEENTKLARSLENSQKDKTCLDEEVRSVRGLLKTKSEELENLAKKVALSEEVQEKLREQIVKDANSISDLGSQVALFNKELQEAKGKVMKLLLLIVNWCRPLVVKLASLRLLCLLRVSTLLNLFGE